MILMRLNSHHSALGFFQYGGVRNRQESAWCTRKYNLKCGELKYLSKPLTNGERKLMNHLFILWYLRWKIIKSILYTPQKVLEKLSPKFSWQKPIPPFLIHTGLSKFSMFGIISHVL